MHASGRVDFRLELAGDVGELGALEDVEVVIGGVAARVAFSADSGAWRVNVRSAKGNGARFGRGNTHRR